MNGIDDKLIKEVNRIFHEEEAKLYDERHPEIEKERESWNYVLSKYPPNSHKNLKILDVGTGTGFVPLLIDKFSEESLIICADISKQMLQTAKIKLAKSKNYLEFIVCDAENLPFKYESVNIVTINSTLHHIPNYMQFLNKTNRILSEEGFLFIMHEPNRLFWNSHILSKVSKVMHLYLGFKHRVKRSKKGAKGTEFFDRVNQKLIDEKVITQPISPREIQSLVDIHSPTASGMPNRSKGFIPEEIINQLKCFTVLEIKTYNHLGKIDPKKDTICFLLNSFFAKVFKREGYMFFMVLIKNLHC